MEKISAPKTAFFSHLLYLVLIVAILHILALKFYFYSNVWWFDMVVHFLGGFWIALAVLWFLFFSGYIKLRGETYIHFLFIASLSALFAGIVWEIFEVTNGVTSVLFRGYWKDTMSDIIFDCLGALASSRYLFIEYKKQNNLSR